VESGLQRIVDSEERPMSSRFAHYSWGTLPREDREGAIEIMIEELEKMFSE
jgi:hypothetical protein